MKILLAEDDRVSRRLLEITLTNWGHEIVLAVDGIDAWQALSTPAPINPAIGASSGCVDAITQATSEARF